MWTEEARISYLIFDNVKVEMVRLQIYQAFFHIETFKRFIPDLHEAVRTLAFHNFARSQTCHMTDGIFGEGIHSAKMESAKVKVLGLLGIVIPAGHRFLRSLKQARKIDRQNDWSKVRGKLIDLEDLYRRARNACEHLDQRIYRGEYSELHHFSFSIHYKLRFLDDKGELLLDFSEGALNELVQMGEDVMAMVESIAKSKGNNLPEDDELNQ